MVTALSQSLTVGVKKESMLSEETVMHRLSVTGKTGRSSPSTSGLMVVCMRRWKARETIRGGGGPNTTQANSRKGRSMMSFTTTQIRLCIGGKLPRIALLGGR